MLPVAVEVNLDLPVAEDQQVGLLGIKFKRD